MLRPLRTCDIFWEKAVWVALLTATCFPALGDQSLTASKLDAISALEEECGRATPSVTTPNKEQDAGAFGTQAAPVGESPSRLVKAGRDFFLDGVKIEPFKAPQGHHPGSHTHMYSYSRDGIQRFIKITGDPEEGRSALLAQDVGGPRVFRARSVVLPDSDKTWHYVEVEQLFHGQRSYTFKGLFLRRDPDAIHELTGRNPPVVARIADLYVRAFERRLLPDTEDVDFIFSGDEVHWLDTAHWDEVKEIDQRFGKSLNLFLNGLNRILREHVDEGGGKFLEELLRRLSASKDLTEAEKRQIVADIYYPWAGMDLHTWETLLEGYHLK
jgi:hypothetical protein